MRKQVSVSNDFRLTVHIGLHKTGTTFIQNILFPEIESIHVIRGWQTHRDLINSDFNKKIVISDEAISGKPWHGNYLEDFKVNMWKLKKLYGNPRIIFGIRRQDEFILSLYKQYLHEGGTHKIDYLFNKYNTGAIKKEELFLKERIVLLKELFDDVFIYSLESIKNKNSNFVKSLSDFLNINDSFKMPKEKKQNVGVKSKFQVESLRKLNVLNKALNRTIKLDLYSKPFRKLKITPRNICQNWLKIGKVKYELKVELKDFLIDFYSKDWEESQRFLSF